MCPIKESKLDFCLWKSESGELELHMAHYNIELQWAFFLSQEGTFIFLVRDCCLISVYSKAAL